ncbi:MAG: bifunctional tetrahydrofolate synthase/dihydrofolate synthase [Betaproteobacteria bacterium HGW-Betaproteobacteria-8]|nr:MAG: bifunctional tetrahydrofolate synthase/dihydrofolate synthase [Betaproteobacteria bacterium HGW-Betaproteobacteria-8]
MGSNSSLPSDVAGWLHYIEALHPKSIAMGLDRVYEVKNRLGLNPDFPLIIVGGTNGKGSTCAMLESIYHQAGYRVASYSSPHLLRYNERVRIDTEEVSDSLLLSAFAAVEAARQEIQLTYFEFGTLAAVWCFIQQKVELGILEVGLGGRLDAVNVFEPNCTIVTTVDIDHIDFLGDSRESIGFEKAGIFRRDIPAICGDPSPPGTLVKHALTTGANLRVLGRDFNVWAHGDSWDFVGARTIENLPFPALKGDFQLGNAACALAAIEAMQTLLPTNDDAIVTGLNAVRLAGRFQVVGTDPQVILDVTHNPHAAIALAENLHQTKPAGKTIAVFSMLADKDVAGVITALVPEIDAWYLSSVDHVRAASVAQLIETFNEIGAGEKILGFANLTDAFRQACLDAGKNDRIIVFGSFFTVAEVMRILPTVTSNISS